MIYKKSTNYLIVSFVIVATITFSSTTKAVERDASFEDGYYYLNNQRFDEALTVFWRLSGKGDARAQYYLGMMKDSGIGTSQDIFGAVRWIKKSAAQNYGPSLAFMGDACKNGHGTTQNLSEAYSWYEKASKLGDPHSQNEMGIMLRDGIPDHPQDLNQAVILFNTAAKTGYAPAYYNLGKLYSEGVGLQQDYKKAIEMFRTAVKGGDVDSLYELGNIYFEGKGGFKSKKAALDHYYAAATKGNKDAMLSLGKMYETSDGDKSKGPKDAAVWYEKAKDLGNVEAYYRLGLLYENGKGVEKDEEKAFKLYEYAHNQEFDDASLVLARMYEDGRGIKTNLYVAKNIYLKMARYGNPFAMLEVGRFFRYGIGGNQDFITAYQWFSLASKLLDDEEKKAAAIVARIETTNNLSERDLQFARDNTANWKPIKKRKK